MTFKSDLLQWLRSFSDSWPLILTHSVCLQGWSLRGMSHVWPAVTEEGKVFLGIRPSKQQITQTNIQLRQDSSGREGEMTEDRVVFTL